MFFSSTLGFHHDKRWFFHQRPWDGQHAAIHWDFWMDDPHQWRDATSGCWMIGHGQPYVHVTSSKHGWLVESGCLELARCFSSRSKLDSPWCSHGAYYYLQYAFLLSARTCFFFGSQLWRVNCRVLVVHQEHVDWEKIGPGILMKHWGFNIGYNMI